MTGITLTLSELAKDLEVDRKTLERRIKRAAVNPVGKCGNAKTYLYKDVAKAVFQSKTNDSLGYQVETLEKPLDVKNHWQAEQEKINYGRLANETMEREAAERAFLNLASVTSDWCEMIPPKLEQALGLNGEQVEVVQKLIDGHRNQLANMDLSNELG